MTINTLTDSSTKIPKGDWQYVFDITDTISPETMNSVVLSLYDSYSYDSSELISEAVQLPDKIGYAWLIDGHFKQSTYDKMILEDLVLFYYAVEGCHIQQIPQKGEMNQAGVRLSLSVYPKANKQVRRFRANLNYQYLAVGIKLTEFHKRYGDLLENTHIDLQQAFSLDADEPCWQFYPLKNNIKTICNDIMESRDSLVKGLRYSFLQGKFLELLCITLNYIFQIDHIPSQRINLTEADLEKIRSAKEIIDIKSDIRPTLDSLASDLIISRKKLAYGFKAFYGIGVNEYYNQERLEHARRELQKGELNMLDIIDLSGYQSQAAFSRAYKNYFGHTPKTDKAS